MSNPCQTSAPGTPRRCGGSPRCRRPRARGRRRRAPWRSAAQRLLGHAQRHRRVGASSSHSSSTRASARPRPRSRARSPAPPRRRSGAREDDVLQPRRAEQRRQPGVVLHRQAVADRARDRQPEPRRRRAHAQVAGGREREPAAHREAVDERDGRLAHRLQPPDDAVDRGLVGEPVLGRSKSANWRMSVPATNAFSPAPRSTSDADVVVGVDASRSAANSASYIANVIALCASGRLNVTHAAGPRRSYGRQRSISRRARAQDLVGVLAQQRRRPADRARRVAELHRDAERVTVPSTGCSTRTSISRACVCGSANTCGVVVDRPGGTPASISALHPFVGVARGERRLELRDQLGAVRHAVGVGREARVVRPAPRARSPRTAAPTASGCCRRP